MMIRTAWFCPGHRRLCGMTIAKAAF